MNLDDALDHIEEVRAHVSRARTFQGYRSLTVATVGGLAIAGAWLQSVLIPSPTTQLGSYLKLWIGIATLSSALVAGGLWRHIRSQGLRSARAETLAAVDRLAPSIGVGVLVTLGIVGGAPDAGWMLPGLWSSVFALGVFAAARQLPRPVFGVGLYFAGCGLAILLGGPEVGLSPWSMGVSFGGGLLLGATILRRTVERHHDVG